MGDPCKIDMQHQWYVHVLHCDGTILDWCDKRYTNLKTKCGHLDIKIPPGCYMVVATWSPARDVGGPPTSLGNHISHLAAVRVNCGDHACVTLFPPTFHYCGIWWLTPLRQYVEDGRINRDVGQRAIEAVEAVLEEAGGPDPFTAKLLKNKELLQVPKNDQR